MMNAERDYAGVGVRQGCTASYDPRANSLGGSLETSPQIGKHHSAFDQVDQLQRQSMILARRVNELVYRIVGPSPESGETPASQRPVGGMLDAIDETCREPNMQIRRALDALDRLEAALPQQ